MKSVIVTKYHDYWSRMKWEMWDMWRQEKEIYEPHQPTDLYKGEEVFLEEAKREFGTDMEL